MPLRAGGGRRRSLLLRQLAAALTALLGAAALSAGDPRGAPLPGLLSDGPGGLDGAIILAAPSQGAAEAVPAERLAPQVPQPVGLGVNGGVQLRAARIVINGQEIEGDGVQVRENGQVLIVEQVNGQQVIRFEQLGMLPNGGPAITPDVWRTWIFRAHSEESARQQAQQALEARLQQLSKACALTPEQTEKLELAGQGDIERFLTDCETAVGDLFAADQSHWQPAQLQRLRRLAVELRNRYQQGLHGADSMFVKTARRVLDERQQKMMERQYQAEQERRLPARNAPWDF